MRLLILLLLIIRVGFAQSDSSSFIPSEEFQGFKVMKVAAGSCASPDGNMLITATVPPNYTWLNTNGYCFAIGPKKNFSMCFNFTSIGTSVNLNAGYASTGCSSISFSGFQLYRCSPSCVLVGAGFNFTGLTPGQCYTWCFNGSCSGPGPGFSSVCPYWMNTTILPIELILFQGECVNDINKINWICASETNTDYFILERSLDGIEFSDLTKQKAAGNSTSQTNYEFNDFDFDNNINYYRLKQVDLNGEFKYFNIISIDNSSNNSKLTVVKRINTLGQEVDDSYEGVYIEIYNNGTAKRKCCNIIKQQ